VVQIHYEKNNNKDNNADNNNENCNNDENADNNDDDANDNDNDNNNNNRIIRLPVDRSNRKIKIFEHHTLWSGEDRYNILKIERKYDGNYIISGNTDSGDDISHLDGKVVINNYSGYYKLDERFFSGEETVNFLTLVAIIDGLLFTYAERNKDIYVVLHDILRNQYEVIKNTEGNTILEYLSNHIINRMRIPTLASNVGNEEWKNENWQNEEESTY